MNLNEYKRSFLFKSPSSSSHSSIPSPANCWKCFIYSSNIFVIAKIQSLTSQIFGVVGPLGKNLDFLSPLAFNIQTNSDHNIKKIKLYSVRALKRCLDEKNLIPGRVMATISKI